jgi:hypothetical protein
MSSKQRYVIQTNLTGGATFRIPLDKEGTVDDAMLLISPRMSSILKTEVRVTNVLVAKTNLFEEDILADVVDADEMIFVELVEAADTASLVGDESKYIDMSEEKHGSEKKEDKSEDKPQREYVNIHNDICIMYVYVSVLAD